MFDKDESLRRFLNVQYIKMKNLSAVGSLVLLTLNLSFVMYPFIEHRFPERVLGLIPRPWVGVPLVFFVTMFFIWFFAHLYVTKLEMYRTEKRAEMLFNPYQIYAIQPFQEMVYRHINTPLMRSVMELLPDGSPEKDDLRKDYLMVRNWLELGYIPKKDFPSHLKGFYITEKERRL